MKNGVDEYNDDGDDDDNEYHSNSHDDRNNTVREMEHRLDNTVDMINRHDTQT